MAAAPQTSASSIDPDEVARFSALAERWWDATGPFAPLHRFNPVRLGFIRDRAAARFGRDPKTSALDRTSPRSRRTAERTA